ncbi:AAA family ATPase [Clostridium sp. LP20]|uniref:AAA family ATPase n=1 Tax=Clostridium sp. LP20 TaxID=3418665 RepID=UPI003EE62BE3
MQLEITGIAITGFRGYKETVDYKFANRTTIKGDNRLGKSSIGEAIVWALTGCDMWGNEKATTKLINDQKPKVTEVVLDFLLDKEPQTIVRRKKGSTNEVYWNESKSSTNDISREIFKNKNVFLSIFNPYFFPELAPKDAKQLLSDVLKPANREEIFEELGDYLKEVLLNNGFRIAETFLSDMRTGLKEQEENIIYLEGVIDGSKPIDVAEKIVFENEEELRILSEELSKLQIPLNNKSKLNELELEERIARQEQKNVSLNQLINASEKVSEKSRLLARYKELDNELKNTKPKLVKCENCGFEKDKTLSYREKIKEEMQNILPKGQLLKIEIEEIDKKNIEIAEVNRKMLEEAEKELNEKLKKINEKRENLLKEDEDRRLNGQEKLRNIKCKADELELRKIDILNHNSQIDGAIKHNEKIKKDLEISKERIQNSKNKIEQIKLAIDAGKQYNSIKLKKQAAEIGKYLKNVSIQFEKLTKDGELKDDFKVLLDGKEFSKLSGSEKITAGLEIGNLLMNIQNLHFPIFVDDGERINNIPELDTQMIVTKVTLDKKINVEVIE